MAKLKLISASVNSLKLQPIQLEPHLHTLLQTHDLAPQIKPKSEPTTKVINLFRTLATQVYKHDSYLFPALRNQFTNSSCNSNNLTYAYPASQIPINPPIFKRNSTQFKQLFQNRNENILRGLILISLSLNSRQLRDNPKKILKVFNQKQNQCFLPEITLDLSRINFNRHLRILRKF